MIYLYKVNALPRSSATNPAKLKTINHSQMKNWNFFEVWFGKDIVASQT